MSIVNEIFGVDFWKEIILKSKEHPGFKAVAARIDRKYPGKGAAILASATRKAIARGAGSKNPRLFKVRGKWKKRTG